MLLAAVVWLGCEREAGGDRAAEAVLPSPAATIPAAAPPNVILLVIDTLRADHVHGYGYPRETTPTLDRFIREGVRFDAAIASSSWSPPSQVTILTGADPHRHKVLTFGFGIESGVYPVTVHLKARGYTTGMFSTHLALHEGVSRILEGLDHRFIDKSSDRNVLDAALEWAKSAAQPYFLYLVLTAPHAPYNRHPAEYDQLYFLDDPPGADRIYPFTSEKWIGEGGIPSSVRMGDENRVGFYVNQYDREIRYVDDLVGQFWSSMDTSGLLDDTLLVVTSDHGEGFGDHDTFAHELHLYDFLVRVPLIMRFPGRIPAGTVWSGQVPLADVAPTILGFAGATLPAGLDGVDLSAALTQKATDPAPRLVTASYRYRGFDRFMVRSDRYKLLLDAVSGRQELYDLRADPDEQVNLLEGGSGAVPEAEHAVLKAALDILLERHGRIAADREPEPLSAEVLEELRALGYVDDQ